MNDYIAKPVDERSLYNKIIGLVKKPMLAKINESVENVNQSNEKCIDLAYLIHITKSDPKLMMEMITLYLEQIPSLINTMKQSLKDKDWKSLQASAHKMIPSFSIMGINSDFEKMTKKVMEYANSL